MILRFGKIKVFRWKSGPILQIRHEDPYAEALDLRSRGWVYFFIGQYRDHVVHSYKREVAA